MRKFQREREGKTIGIWLCERSSHFHATILVCHSFLGDLIEREEERERERDGRGCSRAVECECECDDARF